MSFRIMTVQEETTGFTRLHLFQQGSKRKLIFTADYRNPDDPDEGREMADALAELLREQGIEVSRKDYVDGSPPIPVSD